MATDPRTRQLRARRATSTVVTVALDELSRVTLAYCRRWISERHRLTPAPAVVIRHALDLLAEHLAQLQQDASEFAEVKRRAEVQRVERCAAGRGVDPAAFDRVSAALRGSDSVPPLADLLRRPSPTPEEITETDARDQRLADLIDQVLKEARAPRGSPSAARRALESRGRPRRAATVKLDKSEPKYPPDPRRTLAPEDDDL